MDNKDIYRVPDGYFSDLKSRLYTISEESVPERRGFISAIMPYAALAACFAALVIAGNTILRKTAGGYVRDPETEYYADLLASHSSIFYQEGDYSDESASEDDIIDYLIESGTYAGELLIGQ
ncbi:MAG: hypothetical protein ACI399_07935 [Candidatus Cryptobacteroides sp.]